MDEIKKNLLAAIKEKTNAYQRLTIRDILDISQSLKNLAEAEEFLKNAEKSNGEYIIIQDSRMYGCVDDCAIGFCD